MVALTPTTSGRAGAVTVTPSAFTVVLAVCVSARIPVPLVLIRWTRVLRTVVTLLSARTPKSDPVTNDPSIVPFP